MSTNLKALPAQASPWNKQVAWWIVVVEGGVALALGLFVLLRPEQANVRFIQLLGGYFFAVSAIALYRVIAHKEELPGAPGGYVRAGIGLVAGLIALIHPMMSTISTDAATTVLAVGMALSGVIGLYGFFTMPDPAGRRWSQIIVNFLYLIFAFLVFVYNRGDLQLSGNLIWWVCLFAIGGGIALIIHGLGLRGAANAAAVANSMAASTTPVEAAAVTGEPPSPPPANP